MQSLKIKLDKDRTLSAIFQAPAAGNPLLVLAHGAGAGHDHVHMQSIAEGLSTFGIGTLRFNFPFTEEGRKRVDSQAVSIATIAAAIEKAGTLTDAPLIAAGHSYGGRMATHLLAEQPETDVAGIILFSFPLHPGKKPDTKRALHLGEINQPMLFLSGDRDALAERPLLEKVVAGLPNAKLHWLETADHSFKILKRTRQKEEDVYMEAARTASEWIAELLK